MPARIRRRKSSERKEPLRVSLSTTSRRLRLPVQRTRRHSLKRPSVRLRSAREHLPPRRTSIRRWSTRIRTSSRRPRIRLPRRDRRRVEQSSARNDSSYLKYHSHHTHTHSPWPIPQASHLRQYTLWSYSYHHTFPPCCLLPELQVK
jgi:hypothetical protein